MFRLPVWLFSRPEEISPAASVYAKYIFNKYYAVLDFELVLRALNRGKKNIGLEPEQVRAESEMIKFAVDGPECSLEDLINRSRKDANLANHYKKEMLLLLSDFTI